MWVFFALLFPLLFAIICILDAFFVERVFVRPWIGTITSALASIFGLLLIPFAFPPTLTQPPTNWKFIGIALLAGLLTQVSQGFYFQALADCEAGIVSAYLNLIPVFLPIISYVAFGQAFTVWTYLGITINILASVALCLIDANLEARWHSFGLMVTSSLVYALAVLLENYLFDFVPVLEGFLWVTLGIVLSGSLPLLLPSVRQIFRSNWPTLRPAVAGLIAIEIVNLAAIYVRHRAVSLGDPSLIEAIATIQPGYTFLLSFALCFLAPHFGDEQAKQHLWFKLGLVVLMVLGVRLVAGG